MSDNVLDFKKIKSDRGHSERAAADLLFHCSNCGSRAFKLVVYMDGKTGIECFNCENYMTALELIDHNAENNDGP